MKFYITTPLYYVNGSPHIGHSYTNIACDTLARFYRLTGRDVLFVTGTDEHGQKIKEAAEKNGKEPGEFVDDIVPKFKKLWEKLNISYDDFIRTTEERHIRVVKDILTMLHKKGDLYEGEYSGKYCTPCESFWTESQLIEGKCPDCNRPVEDIKEKNFFLRLSKYRDWLIDYIKSHEDFILPVIRRNEMLSFLENNPLNDLCISRPKSRLSWGIEMPFAKDHVTYVWFDALINYISVCGYGDDKKKFGKYWPADVHVIGKDILRPHAVYWPIMLHASGLELPGRVFAHGWWKVGEDKMSKSKGNIVNPLEMADKYGVDAYRYFLLREVSFGADGSFSEEALITRVNSDLANDLGNLLHRTLSMIDKYFSGLVPERRKENIDEMTKPLVTKTERLREEILSGIKEVDFSKALSAVWELIGMANKFIEQKAPWKLSKENRTEELKDMMYDLYDILRVVSVSLRPFLPSTAESMARQLGVEGANKDFGDLKRGLSEPNTKINKGKPLFPRIETKEK